MYIHIYGGICGEEAVDSKINERLWREYHSTPNVNLFTRMCMRVTQATSGQSQILSAQNQNLTFSSLLGSTVERLKK